MSLEPISDDKSGKRIERAIAWADAHDKTLSILRVIESGDWLDWPPEGQAALLEQLPPSFMGDFHRFLN